MGSTSFVSCTLAWTSTSIFDRPCADWSGRAQPGDLDGQDAGLAAPDDRFARKQLGEQAQQVLVAGGLGDPGESLGLLFRQIDGRRRAAEGEV